MTSKPSALLGSWKDGFLTENAEDILHELIYSLSVLPSPKKNTRSSHLSDENILSWSARILFHEDFPDSVDEKSESSDAFEWQCGLYLLKKMFSFSDENIVEKESYVPPAPHVLLRCIVDRCFERRDEDQDEVTIFKIVCILLVSVAIRNTSNKSTQQRRWRRTQSMCMESIGLFQSIFLGININAYNFDELRILTSLFCDFLSPALCSLIDEMQIASKSKQILKGPDEHKNKAIAAGLVNVASSLSLTVGGSIVESSNIVVQWNTIVVDLTRAMMKIPLFGQDFIWMHPLRMDYESFRNQSLYVHDLDDEEDDLLRIESIMEDRIIRQFSPLLCNSTCDLGLDFVSLCGMNVCWDERALAVMVHAVLLSDTEIAEHLVLFPAVYSESMYFTLLFPQVTNLLSLSQNEPASDNQMEDESGPTSVQRRKQQLYFGMATDVLDCIFARVTKESISPSQIHECHNLTTGPLGPVRISQLLLNHLVQISVPTRRDDDGEYDSQRVLETIRNILAFYSISIQITSIGLLVERCPVPFLVPVLLDLMRKPISSGRLFDVPACLHIIQPFVEEMSNGVSSEDIEELVDNAEKYTCVISLLRLLYLGHHVTWKEKLNETMVDMSRFKVSLQDFVDANSDHEQIFRLSLIDMALDDLLTCCTKNSSE